MQAVIMAGGEGTRLRPLTCSIPKPMVSFFSKPLIHYQITHLKQNGFKDFKFTLMYKPNIVKDYFGDGKAYDANFEYYIEESPLGTAGSVKNACMDVGETFLVISGDCLTDLDINRAIKHHKQKKAKATIVLKKSKRPMDFGIVLFDEQGSITRFLEKPDVKELFSDTVNTGIYIFEPEVLDLIPNDKMCDFAKDVFPKMLDMGMKISGYVMDEYWCDLGNIDSYIKAHEDVLSGLCKVDLDAECINGVYAHKSAKVSNSALIEAPVYLGENCEIKDGVKIYKYSVIGENVVVDENSSIKKGIILKNAYIGKSSKVSCGIICENAKVESKNYVLESAVVGRKTVLCGDNQINPKVKIWPEKWIDKNVNVSENITWGSGKKASIFTNQGIIGDLKIDFDEKTVCDLAHAFAEKFKNEGVLLCGCDTSELSTCYLDIFINTLKLSGQKVMQADKGLLQVLRYGVSIFDVCGAVYFKNLNNTKIKIVMIENDGQTMSRNKIKGIERKFSISEYSMFDEKQIEKVENVDSLKQIYIADIKKGIDGINEAKNTAGISFLNDEVKNLFSLIMDGSSLEYKQIDNINKGNVESQLKRNKCDYYIIFSENSETFNLYTDGLNIDNIDGYLMLIYLLYMKMQKPYEIYLTPLMPDGIIDMAKSVGVKYHVCKFDELFDKNGREFMALYNDCVYFAITLMRYLADKKDVKSDFFDSIPVQHLKEKYVGCEWKDVGMVINEINSKDYTTQALEGIKVFHKNGWGLIYPSDDASKIYIKAQGISEEYAKEICDIHVKEVKEILKKQKTNKDNLI